FSDDPVRKDSSGGGGEGLSEAAVQRGMRGVKVTREGQSRGIAVSFTSIDPEKAARVAHAVVDSYITKQLGLKLATTNRARDWLAQEVGRMREQVMQSERAVAEYRAAHRLNGQQDPTFNPQQLLRLRSELDAAQADRAEKEARLRSLTELR